MAGINVGSLGEYLREQRRNAELSVRQLAEQAGVSNPYLSQIERGLRKPSAEVLQQLARALRISSAALYVRAGLIEEPGSDHSVDAAIMVDPALTERQKRVLLDIYESFRHENIATVRAGGARTPATSSRPATSTTDDGQVDAVLVDGVLVDAVLVDAVLVDEVQDDAAPADAAEADAQPPSPDPDRTKISHPRAARRAAEKRS